MVGVAGRGQQWFQSRWRVRGVFPSDGWPAAEKHRRGRPAGEGATPWRAVLPIYEPELKS